MAAARAAVCLGLAARYRHPRLARSALMAIQSGGSHFQRPTSVAKSQDRACATRWLAPTMADTAVITRRAEARREKRRFIHRVLLNRTVRKTGVVSTAAETIGGQEKSTSSAGRSLA